MNRKQMDYQLGNERPVMAEVSVELHRQVMGAVRNASLEQPASRSVGLIPKLAAGAAATLAVVLIWNNPSQAPADQPLPRQLAIAEPAASGESINQRVAVIGNQVRLPEAALRQELERLESDLKRFRVSS